MRRSVAEVNGVETTVILAQRERGVSKVKWIIGERGERPVRTSSSGGEAVDL